MKQTSPDTKYQKNKWKALAIIFSLLSYGAIKETSRIFSSSAPDIAENRQELIPFAAIFTVLLVILSIWFWRKVINSKPL